MNNLKQNILKVKNYYCNNKNDGWDCLVIKDIEIQNHDYTFVNIILRAILYKGYSLTSCGKLLKSLSVEEKEEIFNIALKMSELVAFE